jgi:DNA-binding transcriptional MerR regulator
MVYTVKQLAAMSGVTVRTLHFYDEMALLKPAYTKANGYRIYEEPQLLILQQILFYRELGFELKRIHEILGQRKFEKIAALKSHRKILEKNVTRTCWTGKCQQRYTAKCRLADYQRQADWWGVIVMECVIGHLKPVSDIRV